MEKSKWAQVPHVKAPMAVNKTYQESSSQMVNVEYVFKKENILHSFWTKVKYRHAIEKDGISI